MDNVTNQFNGPDSFLTANIPGEITADQIQEQQMAAETELDYLLRDRSELINHISMDYPIEQAPWFAGAVADIAQGKPGALEAFGELLADQIREDIKNKTEGEWS